MGSGVSTSHISSINPKNHISMIQSQNTSLKSVNKKFPSKFQSEYSNKNFDLSQSTPTAANNVMSEEIFDLDIEVIKLNQLNPIVHQKTEENSIFFISESLTQKLENLKTEQNMLIAENGDETD